MTQRAISLLLGLTPQPASSKAQDILDAIEAGVVSPTDTVYTMAKKLGINHPYKVQYQVERLKRDGRWPQPTNTTQGD